MKAFCLALVLVGVLAIDIQHSAWTRKEQQILTEIQSSNWASFILNYAELHLKTQGYLQQLVEAIQELIGDLESELDELIHQFNRRTDNHNADVARLTQELEDADRDIFNANDMIDNVLFPTRDRLTNTLRQLKANIEQNRKTLQDETNIRNREHQVFEAKVSEHNEALAAIDECLGLLSQLSNPSLVQIKRIQTNLNKIHNHFKNHSVFAPIVMALIELATEQNFSDQGTVATIGKAFSDLRNQVVDSLNQETADENAAQAAFNDRVVQLNAELAEFQRTVLLRTAELNQIEEKLVTYSAYVTQRKADRDSLQGQLDAENDDYARETDIFQNLKAQYLRELQASNAALALITQPSFESYCKSKLGF